MNSSESFKWRQFLPEIIILNVRWYLRYALSYRDLEEMMLSAKRDGCAAKHFFRKVILSNHASPPYALTVDKNPAFPIAFEEAQEDGLIPKGCKLRQIRYLVNIAEQDHRFIKRLVNPRHGVWFILDG